MKYMMDFAACIVPSLDMKLAVHIIIIRKNAVLFFLSFFIRSVFVVLSIMLVMGWYVLYRDMFGWRNES